MNASPLLHAALRPCLALWLLALAACPPPPATADAGPCDPLAAGSACPPPADPACTDARPCSAGLLCEAGACVGGAGATCADTKPCGAGITCQAGTCVTQCSDGVDNDGDGLVDWQLDLGCTGPDDPTEGGLSNALDHGWTVFEKNADTSVFYVSSSTGDDSRSGQAPEWNGTDGPLKTVAAGVAKLKDGRPDWLLFRRGDTWVNESFGNFKISGRAEDAPVVIGSYGASTARPRFELTGGDWLITHGGGGASANRAHVRIVGQHIVMASKDPDDGRFTGQGGSCIQWLRDGGDVLIEDVRCDYAQLNLQSAPTLPFVVRRSVFFGNYSLNSHAQNTFTSIAAPLTFEENLFLHGGWSDVFHLAAWGPSTNVAAWAAVRDGCIGVDLDGRHAELTGLDFDGVSGLADVAARLEASLTSAFDAGPGGLSLRASDAGALQLRAPSLRSGPGYAFTAARAADGGAATGTDLAALLNLALQGAPESTIFNRNMYLSHGHGNTTVRGNIDARGASGGVQQRMGGVNEGNLFIEDPHAVVFGSNQNDPGFEVGGVIRDNVILGSHDIDTQVQGTGIFITSTKAVIDSDGGPSLVRGLKVTGNTIAHNVHGTFNIKAIALVGDGVTRDVEIAGNVIYDWARPSWSNPMDQRAHGLILTVASGSSNIEVHHNVVQQVDGGFCASSGNDAAGVTLHDNTYYSAAPNPPDVWSRGWFELGSSVSLDTWRLRTGESDAGVEAVKFVDPNRTLSTYMASLGGEASVDGFLAEALAQSRLHWRPAFTAAAVNPWVRAGFVRTK